MSPKVSVIVPFHNVERYINQCLESLVLQSLKEIEIIVINDCSTDRTEEIVLEYVARDARIKYLKNETNIGPGLSRNTGISVALGKYIGFVDSDDWVERTMFEDMFFLAEKSNSDIVGSNFYLDYEDGKQIKNDRCHTCESQTCFCALHGFVWLNIYKTEFIRTNKIYFGNERFLEDLLFNIEVYACKPRKTFLQQHKYHYLQRASSLIRSKYKYDLINRYFLFYQNATKILKEKDYYNQETERELGLSLFSQTFNFVANSLYAKGLKNKLIELGRIIKDKTIILNMKNFKFDDIPKSSSIGGGFVKRVIYVFFMFISIFHIKQS